MKKKDNKCGTFEIWDKNWLPDGAGIECSYSILGNEVEIDNLRIVLEEDVDERSLEIAELFEQITSFNLSLIEEIIPEAWDHYKNIDGEI